MIRYFIGGINIHNYSLARISVIVSVNIVCIRVNLLTAEKDMGIKF